MKLNPRVTELALYDIKGGPGQQILIAGFGSKLTIYQGLPPI